MIRFEGTIPASANRVNLQLYGTTFNYFVAPKTPTYIDTLSVYFGSSSVTITDYVVIEIAIQHRNTNYIYYLPEKLVVSSQDDTTLYFNNYVKEMEGVGIQVTTTSSWTPLPVIVFVNAWSEPKHYGAIQYYGEKP